MRDFWNSQFKFSEVLPDFADSVARMAADSRRVSDSHTFDRQSYGTHPRQWVEWISGRGPETLLPVILHGGYWRALEAETHRFMMPAFRDHGAFVANVEYRLMPEVRLGDVVADTLAAVRLLMDRFPSSKLLLIGHSAGAHLAVSALRDPDVARRTQGVLALSGVYDLAPVALSFLQDELQLTQEEQSTFSLAADEPRPPVLYVNGAAETHEFLRSGALMSRGERAGWSVLDRENHMSLTWAACAQSDALVSSLIEMETSA
jgi:arylformamidase